jgi:hypothetical protein
MSDVECPDGHKCLGNDWVYVDPLPPPGTPWYTFAEDVAGVCVPIPCDAIPPGDACEPGVEQNFDPCDAEHVCGFDYAAEETRCLSVCDPLTVPHGCEGFDACLGFGFCAPGCDPLLDECDAGDGCFSPFLPTDTTMGFVCVPAVGGAPFCGSPNECDAGELCISNDVSGQVCFEDDPDLPCCLAACDLDAPTCDTGECVPYYLPAEAPSRDAAALGFCSLE